MADAGLLKRELAALGERTELGFEAGGEAVERIKALANELEALNPTSEPAYAADRLRGRWRMLYSSFGLQRETTLARLSFNLLPKTSIRVDAVFQEVDPETGLYDNVVNYTGADGPGLNVTAGRFSPAGPQRLDVVFFEVQDRLSGREPVRVPIDNQKIPPLFSDVTYVDDDFRLNRGGFGNLYVLAREDAGWTEWSRGR